MSNNLRLIRFEYINSAMIEIIKEFRTLITHHHEIVGNLSPQSRAEIISHERDLHSLLARIIVESLQRDTVASDSVDEQPNEETAHSDAASDSTEMNDENSDISDEETSPIMDLSTSEQLLVEDNSDIIVELIPLEFSDD